MSKLEDSSWMDMLAQREERGSNSATSVKAIVPASGNEFEMLTETYSRMAKRAVRCQHVVNRCGRE